MRSLQNNLIKITCAFFGVIFTCNAGDALFIGNSYTFGGAEPSVHGNGGVPKLVEVIAASKGRKLSSTMLTVGGKDWGYHLQQPATTAALASKKWNWVILQNLSVKPTHIGDPDAFFRDGEAFYRRIRENSPQTKIVLFETWARAKGNPLYTGVSTSKSFADPAQMDGELQTGYVELDHRLENIDPGSQVELAPVGAAFALCLKEHPEIPLHWKDNHHANTQGSYLAALVIYATIFQDSPLGATSEFFGVKLDKKEAEELQEIAAEAVSANPPASVATRAAAKTP